MDRVGEACPQLWTITLSKWAVQRAGCSHGCVIVCVCARAVAQEKHLFGQQKSEYDFGRRSPDAAREKLVELHEEQDK